MTDALNLEVIEGPDAGLQVPLVGSLLIGREDTCDVRLDDPRVSREHARITASGSEATVEDLCSANGTFVNHAQVHATARLTGGDELLLGTSVLAVRTAAEVRSQPSAVRAIPPPLAAPERRPDYVEPGPGPATPPAVGPPELTRLLDSRVRAQARLAPVAMLALVALALVIYFAAR